MRRLFPCLALLMPALAHAQPERGATALAHAVEGLGVTTRVLMIGAHPDDEDTRLITWLQRGRHVETAYLSLTRGDGGQNLIGNELYEGLGAIRTEELLAARRIDGARQYFTRAYDFGFSKTVEDTYKFWPKDTILGDVVRVVRAFRPHVIVPVFSGTARDGHGHHQVSGILAREVFDAAADTVRYPARGFGAGWATPKLYHQRTYWNHEGATYRYDAGEYDPVLGASYAEIAARSRSQHKSQAFGSLEPKGAVVGSLARERTRVNESTPAGQERGIFDGIDTTWARFARVLREPARRAALDSLPGAFAAARAALDVRDPARALPALGRAERLLRERLCGREGSGGTCDESAPDPLLRDLAATQRQALARVHQAIALAAGVEMLVTTPREVVPDMGRVPLRLIIHNRGTRRVSPARVREPAIVDTSGTSARRDSMVLAPGDSLVHDFEMPMQPMRYTQPWWLVRPRQGALFSIGENARVPEDRRSGTLGPVLTAIEVDGAYTELRSYPVRRFADPIKGEQRRPAAVAPAIAVTLDDGMQYVPARQAIDRTVRVRLRSADTARRDVVVRLALPKGLTTDSATRTVMLAGYDARATATFRVRGALPAGRHVLSAVAESGRRTFSEGYVEIAYDHIRPQRLYRQAVTELVAVDVKVPAGLKVAYVPGVGDNVAPALAHLGLDVTVLSPDSVALADLSRFRTVVLGPRVYEANPALAAANGRLLDWARTGGTLVVQYQQDIARRGLAPLPLTLAQRAERVTEEDAPVRLLDPAHPLLASPNRIGPQDFTGWVQERGLYMPSTFDAGWTPLVETADAGMTPNRGGILVAPLGRGTYVLTTLAFFRQLPGGNGGAARLFINLLAAGGEGGGSVAP